MTIHRIKTCAGAIALAFGTAGTLIACNSSSSSSTGSGGSTSTISGTAAAGAAVSGATVTLKDAAGHQATTTTGSDGSYSIAVTGFTPPFLLSVPGGGTTLYGYTSAAGTMANLTPYSTFTLAGFYLAEGTDIGTAFSGAPSSATLPTAAQLDLLLKPLLGILQPFLSNAGVTNPASFNPLNTAFSANHTGFDEVLDRTHLTGSGLGFTVDNGSGTTVGPLSSTASETVQAASGSSAPQVVFHDQVINTTTQTASLSQQTVPVGMTPAQQTDLANAEVGVLTLFNNLGALAHSKPGTVSPSDVASFVDPSYLQQGDSAATLQGNLAAFLNGLPSGATVTPTLLKVNSFSDGAPQLLDTTVKITIAPPSGPATVRFLDDNEDVGHGLVFKLSSSGAWVFFGDQTHYKAHANLTATQFYDANQGAGLISNTIDMQAQVGVPVNALTAASISGPANSLPDCSSTPSPFALSTVNLTLDQGLFNGGTTQRFDLPCSFTDAGATSGVPPPAGTPYTFTLTPTGGAAVTQGWTLNALTGDNGDLTQLDGQARSTFASSATAASLRGTTLSVAWTEPTTYPLLYTTVTAFCQNATEAASGGGSDIQGTGGNILPGTLLGSVSIPASSDGSTTARVAVSVNFIGANGERSQLTQNIHN